MKGYNPLQHSVARTLHVAQPGFRKGLAMVLAVLLVIVVGDARVATGYGVRKPWRHALGSKTYVTAFADLAFDVHSCAPLCLSLA